MTTTLPVKSVHSVRVAACFAVALAWLSVESAAAACQTLPDLHIGVSAKFDTTPVRSDYTIADIAALARKQNRDAGGALLGFYTSQFGYSIDIVPEGDPACPAQIEAVVTLRLQHRLIEVGQETAENDCVYPGALRHYRRLAEVDEQTVEHFSAHAAAMLAQASPVLKQTYAPLREDLDAALHDKIRAIVDEAIAPLHDARQDAQQAVNNSAELAQLASSCSI